MKRTEPAGASPDPVVASTWLRLSLAAALVAVVGNVLGLTIPGIYAGLTPAFYPQAIAQDVANLAIVAPLWMVLAVLALRGSRKAMLLWLGVLTFTGYNYVIYAFSIPFGPLFYLWVAVLGAALFSLIGGLAVSAREDLRPSYTSPRLVSVVGGFLIVTAVLFAFVWLSEDIPALLRGTRPQSLIDMALPTNPVHILDVGFFLPAVLATGILLLRKRPLAYVLAPGFIVFLILTGVPILLTPVVQSVRGETAVWSIFGPIGTLTVVLLGLLAGLMRTIKPVTKSD